MSQDGRETAIRAGELCGHGTSRPYTFRGDSRFELLLFGILRSLLGLSAERIFSATATPLNPIAGEMARLRQDFLRNLAFELESGRVDAAAPGLAECVASLTRGMYADTHAGVVGDHPEMLYRQLLAYIDAHLGQPELGAGDVARANYISVRRLQKLFHEHLTTLSG